MAKLGCYCAFHQLYCLSFSSPSSVSIIILVSVLLCKKRTQGKGFFLLFCIINVHNKEVVVNLLRVFLQKERLVYLHHLKASVANTPKGETAASLFSFCMAGR